MEAICVFHENKDTSCCANRFDIADVQTAVLLVKTNLLSSLFKAAQNLIGHKLKRNKRKGGELAMGNMEGSNG